MRRQARGGRLYSLPRLARRGALTLVDAGDDRQAGPQRAELAGTALFLATDDASHMTGGYMVADGGYNMVGA